MRTEDLPNRITVLKPNIGQDELGQPIDTWTNVIVRLPANVKNLSGSETIKAGAPTSVVKASIRIRYLAALNLGINAGMRAIDENNTVYNVAAVLPDVAKKRHVDLVCEVINDQ